jgi:hypothetical protein
MRDHRPSHRRIHDHPMMFPYLTRQQITLDGTWQTTDPHCRLTGTLSSSAPFVILSLLNCSEMYHYMKHAKCNDLDVSLVWYQMKFPGVDRYQHTISIADSVNLGAHSEGRICLSALYQSRFPLAPCLRWRRTGSRDRFSLSWRLPR